MDYLAIHWHPWWFPPGPIYHQAATRDQARNMIARDRKILLAHPSASGFIGAIRAGTGLGLLRSRTLDGPPAPLAPGDRLLVLTLPDGSDWTEGDDWRENVQYHLYWTRSPVLGPTGEDRAERPIVEFITAFRELIGSTSDVAPPNYNDIMDGIVAGILPTPSSDTYFTRPPQPIDARLDSYRGFPLISKRRSRALPEWTDEAILVTEGSRRAAELFHAIEAIKPEFPEPEDPLDTNLYEAKLGEITTERYTSSWLTRPASRQLNVEYLTLEDNQPLLAHPQPTPARRVGGCGLPQCPLCNPNSSLNTAFVPIAPFFVPPLAVEGSLVDTTSGRELMAVYQRVIGTRLARWQQQKILQRLMMGNSWEADEQPAPLFPFDNRGRSPGPGDGYEYGYIAEMENGSFFADGRNPFDEEPITSDYGVAPLTPDTPVFLDTIINGQIVEVGTVPLAALSDTFIHGQKIQMTHAWPPPPPEYTTVTRSLEHEVAPVPPSFDGTACWWCSDCGHAVQVVMREAVDGRGGTCYDCGKNNTYWRTE